MFIASLTSSPVSMRAILTSIEHATRNCSKDSFHQLAPAAISSTRPPEAFARKAMERCLFMFIASLTSSPVSMRAILTSIEHATRNCSKDSLHQLAPAAISMYSTTRSLCKKSYGMLSLHVHSISHIVSSLHASDSNINRACHTKLFERLLSPACAGGNL